MKKRQKHNIVKFVFGYFFVIIIIMIFKSDQYILYTIYILNTYYRKHLNYCIFYKFILIIHTFYIDYCIMLI